MKPFFIKSTILTTIVFLLGLGLYSTVLKQFSFSALPYVLLFFYLVTNLVHFCLLKIGSKTNSRFVSQYMAVNFIKLFFYLVAAIVFVILNREFVKVFIANYLLLYLIYTVFEVNEFLKKIKQAG